MLFDTIQSLSIGQAVLLTFLTGIGAFVLYAYNVYTVWESHFGRTRVSRRELVSPSNRQPPDIKSWQTNKNNILQNADKHPGNYASCELLYPLKKASAPGKNKPDFLKARAKRISMTVNGKGRLLDEKADELDMDHVYVSYPELLWAYIFIGPNSLFLWVRGVYLLKIRVYLVKWGWIKVKPFDPAEIVGRLCLEGTLAVHYYATTKKDSELGNVAGFFFADFPYIDDDCKPCVADLFAVDIDLDTKKMVKAKLDDEMLTASEALTLCWFYTICANHVKMHSLANWGVNNEPQIKEQEPFLFQNSLVTTIYNFFGYSCFHSFMSKWESMGLLSPGWDPNAWVACVNHGIKDSIWAHPQIEELIPHSSLINFIVKVRAVFLTEFAKYKKRFPCIDGEAMFVGTILHSLDHTCMDWNLEDALWLDVDCPRFGKMAEIGRIVKVGFVKDVPGLMFHKRFKDSGHPFYDSIYKKACKIDKKLADNMDTCIIK